MFARFSSASSSISVLNAAIPVAVQNEVWKSNSEQNRHSKKWLRKDVIECQSLEDSDEKIDTSPPRKQKLIKEMSF